MSLRNQCEAAKYEQRRTQLYLYRTMARTWLPWVDKINKCMTREEIKRPAPVASSLLISSCLGDSSNVITSPSKLEKIGKKVRPCHGAICVFRDYVGIYVKESEKRIFVITTDGRDVGVHAGRRSDLVSCRWPKSHYHSLDETKVTRVANPHLSDYFFSVLDDLRRPFS